MSTARETASTSKSVFVAICLVATALWGLYFWKFRAEGDAPPDTIALTPAAADAAVSHTAVMPLSATRTTPPAEPVVTATPADETPIESPSLRVAANSGAQLDPATAGRSAPPLQIQDPTPQPGVTRTTASSVDADILAGRRAMERGQLVEARTRLSKALQGRLSMEQQESVRLDLAQIADKLTFGKLASPGDPLARMYEVASGESLYILAKRHKVTVDFLAKVNQLPAKNMIRAGQRLKVVEGPFRAVVRKSQHRMDLFLGDQYVRSYRVGLGMDDGTPIGEWEVTTKQANPAWTDPRDGQHYSKDDPRNPIGEYWIGLDCVAGECVGRNGFGIHGTIDPASVGRDESMGCVRLLADDIEELYDLLVSGYSVVAIVP